MKKYLLVLFLPLVCFICISCSKNLRKISPPVEDVLHHGPLSRILVYSGNVALGQSGANPAGMTLNIGGIAVLSAQGRDINNRPIKIDPVWATSKPEIVEINPSKGDIVSIKGLREGSAEIVAEYKGVKTTVEYIFVK